MGDPVFVDWNVDLSDDGDVAAVIAGALAGPDAGCGCPDPEPVGDVPEGVVEFFGVD